MSKLVGILNVTTDSFSDGGKYFDTGAAISKALELYQAGADYVEIGPASSNPLAEPVSIEEELSRAQRIIPELKKHNIPFALDSAIPETQIYALSMGAEMINDISGFPDQSIYTKLADSRALLVVMHSMHNTNIAGIESYTAHQVIAHIYEFFGTRLEELLGAGVSQDRLVIDPGMGFFLSSQAEVSIATLLELEKLAKKFKTKMLVSVSRKSFLREISQSSVQDSLPATLAAELFCVRVGVDYIRTHDVSALKAAMQIEKALS